MASLRQLPNISLFSRVRWLERIACDPRTEPSEFAVASAISLHFYDPETGWLAPSHNEIATHCGLSLQSVKNAVKTLRDGEWITSYRRAGEMHDPSNIMLRFGNCQLETA